MSKAEVKVALQAIIGGLNIAGERLKFISPWPERQRDIDHDVLRKTVAHVEVLAQIMSEYIDAVDEEALRMIYIKNRREQ